MSPRETANKWAPGAVSSLIVGLILFFVQVAKDDTSAMNAKIDKKADKEYVDQQVDNVKREIGIQNEWIIKTLDKLDKRTERIEDKIDKK